MCHGAVFGTLDTRPEEHLRTLGKEIDAPEKLQLKSIESIGAVSAVT